MERDVGATKMITKFQEKVYNVVQKIPKGKILSYKEVAKLTGSPRASRAVGNALNRNPFKEVPCHRVIKSDGTLGGYAKGAKEKARILKKEGYLKNGL